MSAKKIRQNAFNRAINALVLNAKNIFLSSLFCVIYLELFVRILKNAVAATSNQGVFSMKTIQEKRSIASYCCLFTFIVFGLDSCIVHSSKERIIYKIITKLPYHFSAFI